MTTSKDPLWRDILDRMASDDLDPSLFEQCAADLLRDLFPGLVPVPGGSDAGMDGAISDGAGEAYPLIATTGQRFEKNLSASLDSYLAQGGLRRKAVFATSRKVTPPQRRKLETLARAKGFTLIQVVERQGMADRLYRHPRWRRELLGLSGEPPALSAVPVSRRPFVDLPLIGHDQEKEWLEKTTGDRVLAGEPGSGKTFLLAKLATGGWGLFLASEDETAISNAVRTQKPRVVVVDDAHRDLRQLEGLRRLRANIDADFDIVATTWPGGSEAVVTGLGVEDRAKVRRLELLPRDQIVRIIHSVGIAGPDDLVRILVDQAANKPGLAVTLARLALVGGEEQFRDVVLGRALARDLTVAFRELVGDRAESILAAFGLGGDGGMTLAGVAEALNVSLPDLHRAVLDLAAGGVLSEAGPKRLAVWPRALRANLVASMFFHGDGTDLPFRQLLDRAPDFSKAVETIIDAVGRGASLRPARLHDLVLEAQERANREEAEFLAKIGAEAPELARSLSGSSSLAGHRTNSLWYDLAALGPDHAKWALDHFPGPITEIAKAALWVAPEVTIPRLLEVAGQSDGRDDWRSRPMEILGGWVRHIGGGPEDWLSRRRQLCGFARLHIKIPGSFRVGLEALALALSPGIAGTSRDPGMGRAIRVQQGILPATQLRELRGLWREARCVIDHLDAEAWPPVGRLLQDWIHPSQLAFGKPLAPADKELAHEIAREMIHHFARVATTPGVIAALSDFAEEVAVTLDVEIDPIFALLFPGQGDDGELEPGETRLAELTDLAGRWLKEPPSEIGSRIASYEREAEKVSRSWPPRSQKLCQLIAASADRPEAWADAFLIKGLSGACIDPFVRQVYVQRGENWESLIKGYLEGDRTLWTAADLVLTDPEPTRPLLATMLERAPALAQLIETRSLQGRISLETLLELLRHPEPKVALSAAIGEWSRNPRGEVRPEVAEPWRATILRAETEEEREARWHGLDYWLRSILASCPGLAFEWLVELGKRGKPRFVLEESILRSAIRALETDQRLALIDLLDESWPLLGLIPVLIDRRPELYERLLVRPALDEARLYALEGLPDAQWADLAAMAIESGEDPSSVASAAFWGPYTAVGSGQEFWERWRNAFDRLTADARPAVLEAARCGRAEAEKRVLKAKEEGRRMALEGF
jgi:hypothetical protein